MSSYATQSWVNSQNYLTALPSTANFTTLTLYNNSVATTVYVDVAVLGSAKQLVDALGIGIRKLFIFKSERRERCNTIIRR